MFYAWQPVPVHPVMDIPAPVYPEFLECYNVVYIFSDNPVGLLCCLSYLLFLGAGFPTGGGEGVPFSSFSGFLRVVSQRGATLVN